jgi:O-antigen/teichoic acid export membrane protein
MRGPLRDTGVVFFGNVAARALGFLFPLVLVYSVSKQDFGTVVFFTGTGFLATSMVLNGFAQAMTRSLAASTPDDERPWVASAVIGGAPVVLLAVLFGEALAAWAGAPPGLMALMVLGLSIDSYFWSLLRGLKKFEMMVGYRVASNALQLILIVIVLITGVGNVAIAVTIFALVYVIPIVGFELRYHPIANTVQGRRRPERAAIRELGRYALPSAIAGYGYAMMISADTFMVQLLSPGALPEYATAKALAQPITLVSFALGVVIMPRVAAASERERWRLLRTAMFFATGAGAVITFLYPLVDGFLVGTLLPASYANAVDVLPVLVSGLALLGVFSVLGEWWNGIGRPIVPTIAIAFGAAATLAVQVWLTPDHGGLGASWALLAGSGVALALLIGATVVRYSRTSGLRGLEHAHQDDPAPHAEHDPDAAPVATA